MRSLRWVSMAFVVTVGLFSAVASADKKALISGDAPGCKPGSWRCGLYTAVDKSAKAPTCKDVLKERNFTESDIKRNCSAHKTTLSKNAGALQACEQTLYDWAKKCPTAAGALCEDRQLIQLTQNDAKFACLEIAFGYRPSQVSLSSIQTFTRTQQERCDFVVGQTGMYGDDKLPTKLCQDPLVYVYPDNMMPCIRLKMRQNQKLDVSGAAQQCLD